MRIQITNGFLLLKGGTQPRKKPKKLADLVTLGLLQRDVLILFVLLQFSYYHIIIIIIIIIIISYRTERCHNN